MFDIAMEKLWDYTLDRNVYTPIMKLKGLPCPNALALTPRGDRLASGGLQVIS